MNNTRYIVAGYVENAKDRIEHIIDYLYKNPEVSFNEYKASELLCSILSEEGFKITKDVAGVKNSFAAIHGTSRPRVAYICEYDAADDIGHGNGHNITSAINTGAAIGLKRIVDEIGGSVMVLGCPGEEKHYTKILMLNNGVFDEIDAVICGHARDKTSESGSSLGMTVLNLTFKGKEAHASLNFHEGINALLPCIMLFNNIEILKSRYNGTTFVNGIITKGGSAINIIPGEASCMFMIKSHDKGAMENICEELINCARFAARLYKCDMEFTYPESEYMPLKTHQQLSKIACHNLKERGISDIHGPVTVPESLDIGSVSHRIPVINPYIGICREPVKYYTKEFGDCTVTSYAKETALKAAAALALTGADIIQSPDILKSNS